MLGDYEKPQMTISVPCSMLGLISGLSFIILINMIYNLCGISLLFILDFDMCSAVVSTKFASTSPDYW